MLSVREIVTGYGEVEALHNVSIEVGKNEIVSIIGANGAGKSTVMRSIMGIARPRKGKIFFQGRDITGMATHKIVAAGVVYVPEGRYIFPELSVQDNLKIGAYAHKFSQSEMHGLYEKMYRMFPRLKERRKQKGGTLSGGEQQMLAIARGLMSKPKLIMLDEPSLGLAPIIVGEVFEIIRQISEESSLSIVLVEQNAFKALSFANRGYILENGSIVLAGKGSDLIDDPQIKKAYLGKC
jgi:branched-chain amino acid transport system ATP-binding protein